MGRRKHIYLTWDTSKRATTKGWLSNINYLPNEAAKPRSSGSVK